MEGEDSILSLYSAYIHCNLRILKCT